MAPARHALPSLGSPVSRVSSGEAPLLAPRDTLETFQTTLVHGFPGAGGNFGILLYTKGN